MSASPYLRALADEYTTTVRQLQRSFVGPPDDPSSSPLPEASFWEQDRQPVPGDPFVRAFRSLREEAREACGLDGGACSSHAQGYERYREWLPFHRRRHMSINPGMRGARLPAISGKLSSMASRACPLNVRDRVIAGQRVVASPHDIAH